MPKKTPSSIEGGSVVISDSDSGKIAGAVPTPAQGSTIPISTLQDSKGSAESIHYQQPQSHGEKDMSNKKNFTELQKQFAISKPLGVKPVLPVKRSPSNQQPIVSSDSIHSSDGDSSSSSTPNLTEVLSTDDVAHQSTQDNINNASSVILSPRRGVSNTDVVALSKNNVNSPPTSDNQQQTKATTQPLKDSITSQPQQQEDLMSKRKSVSDLQKLFANKIPNVMIPRRARREEILIGTKPPVFVHDRESGLEESDEAKEKKKRQEMMAKRSSQPNLSTAVIMQQGAAMAAIRAKKQQQQQQEKQHEDQVFPSMQPKSPRQIQKKDDPLSPQSSRQISSNRNQTEASASITGHVQQDKPASQYSEDNISGESSQLERQSSASKLASLLRRKKENAAQGSNPTEEISNSSMSSSTGVRQLPNKPSDSVPLPSTTTADQSSLSNSTNTNSLVVEEGMVGKRKSVNDLKMAFANFAPMMAIPKRSRRNEIIVTQNSEMTIPVVDEPTGEDEKELAEKKKRQQMMSKRVSQPNLSSALIMQQGTLMATIRAKREANDQLQKSTGQQQQDVKVQSPKTTVETAQTQHEQNIADNKNNVNILHGTLERHRSGTTLAAVREKPEMQQQQQQEKPKQAVVSSNSPMAQTNIATSQPIAVLPVTSEWEEYLDDSSGKFYYYNTKTEETTWVKPLNFHPSTETTDQTSMNKQQIQNQEKQQQQQPQHQEQQREQQKQQVSATNDEELFKKLNVSELMKMVKSIRTSVIPLSDDNTLANYIAKFHKSKGKAKVKAEELASYSKIVPKSPFHLDIPEKDEKACQKIYEWVNQFLALQVPDVSLAKELIDFGLINGALRNEIFFYVAKQSNGNSKNVLRGLQLLAALLTGFPPSADLAEALANFLHHLLKSDEAGVPSYSSIVAKRLSRRCVSGARKCPPSVTYISNSFRGDIEPLPIFGAFLEEYLEWQYKSYRKEHGLYILELLMRRLEDIGAYKTEGIFRLSGDIDTIEMKMEKFEYGDFDVSDVKDPHVISSLLKIWLRELAEPIVPLYLYSTCLKAADRKDDCIAVLKQFPEINYILLTEIIQYLATVLTEDFSANTKMEIDSMVVVFAPNLIRCPPTMTDPRLLMTNSALEGKFIKNLILSFRERMKK